MLSSKFNNKHDLNSLYRKSILKIVYEESDKCQKFDDRVIVIVGLLVMTVSDNTKVRIYIHSHSHFRASLSSWSSLSGLLPFPMQLVY